MKYDFLGLFDFESFIKELRCDEKKRSSITRYESIFGEIPNNIYECAFYKDYLHYFKPVEYKVPEEIIDDFNYDLLLRLSAASFSSGYKLINTGQGIELSITVISEKNKITKKISELWPLQIFRLYEIYIEEQINLSSLIYSGGRKKYKKKNPLDTIFFVAPDMNAKMDNNSIPSFDNYINSCSYLQFTKDGSNLIRERYKIMKRYEMNLINIEDISSIFYSNKKMKQE